MLSNTSAANNRWSTSSPEPAQPEPKTPQARKQTKSVGSEAKSSASKRTVQAQERTNIRRAAKASESVGRARPLESSSETNRRQPKQRKQVLNADDLLDDASLDSMTKSGSSNPIMLDNDGHKKQNHCEIEKRRRDRMNYYIMELASIIPSFSSNHPKFDKLTVLRMAVQQVKSLRSSLCSFSSFHLRPSFLSSGNLLKNLILQMADQEAQDNLFMVVTCDRGKVLFVSQSSKDILNHDQKELVGQCLFDLLHKDDVPKVKEQITYFNLMPREMLVDSETLQPIKHNSRKSFNQMRNQLNSTPQPGARRSFFCRMRSGRNHISSSKKDHQKSAIHSWTAPPPPPPLARPPAPPCSPNFEKNRLSQQKSNGTLTETTNAPTQRTQQTSSSLNKTRSKQFSRDNHNRSKQNLSTAMHLSGVTTPGKEKSYQAGDGGHQKRSSSDSCKRKDNSSLECSTRDKLGAGLSDKNINTAKIRNDYDCHGDGELDVTIGSSEFDSSAQVIMDTLEVASPNKLPQSSTSGHAIVESSSNNFNEGQSNVAGRELNMSEDRDGFASDMNISQSPPEQLSSSSASSSPPSSCNESQVLSKLDVSSAGNNNENVDVPQTKPANGVIEPSKVHPNAKKHKRYIVMHCTGYLKPITLRNDEFDDDGSEIDDSDVSSDDDYNENYRTINCFVAVCRRSPMDRYLGPDRPLTFTCRYSMEGKFVFVDQRTTVALGYTPQQLLGTSHYAYCQKDSVNTFKECHRQCILKSEPVSSDIYEFKRANGQHLWLQTSLKSFRNPWTKFIDYIVANHTTAGGSDAHYNEDCVPTKFNQDMSGEEPQLPSPGSTSSLSSPSMDSKKSSSPSSSSISSSYSMDSYASGGSNIQALLNHIDRLKSGSGAKNTLHVPKKISSNRVGGSSAQRSNDDSGHYSDSQSCSSLFSQNSAVSNEFSQNQPTQPSSSVSFNNNTATAPSASIPTAVSTAGNNQSQINQTAATVNYFNSRNTTTVSRATQSQGISEPSYQNSNISSQTIPSSGETINDSVNNYETPIPSIRLNSMPISKKPDRTIKASNEMAKRHHGNNHNHNHNHNHSYANRARARSNTASIIYPPRVVSWNSSGGSVCSSSSGHSSNTTTCEEAHLRELNENPSANMKNQMTSMAPKETENPMQICRESIQQRSCQAIARTPPQYMMQSVDMESMNVLPDQLPVQTHLGGMVNEQLNSSYTSNIVPMTQCMNQQAPIYSNSVDLNEMQHIPTNSNNLSNALQTHIPMNIQTQQQESSIQQHGPHRQRQLQSGQQLASPVQQETVNQGNINMPMIWNQNHQNPYQHNMANMHENQVLTTGGDVSLINIGGGNSTGNQMVTQQTVQCQQCANHKCFSQQPMMACNTDLNSINLTSLAVDGDLDEDQLLEYLAGCDPEAQLYHIQNNVFPQYNIYR